MNDKIRKPESEWMRDLAPNEYRITRLKGTEPAFSGKYWNHNGDGVYKCTCCGEPLFDSAAKFDSRSGWPSFYQPLTAANIASESDQTHGMVRTEVMCSKCDAHLGHVFEDGPQPTGLRYCINSASLKFSKKE